VREEFNEHTTSSECYTILSFQRYILVKKVGIPDDVYLAVAESLEDLEDRRGQ